MVCKKYKIYIKFILFRIIVSYFFEAWKFQKNGKFYMKLDASINIWILKSKTKVGYF